MDAGEYTEYRDYVDCDSCDWSGTTVIGSINNGHPDTAECPDCGTMLDVEPR